MLNLQLSLPVSYGGGDPGYKELSERAYPDLWGCYWGEGARARYAKQHQNPHKSRRPVFQPAQDPQLAEDGRFGPKTESAVIRFQRRCGIPDEGIVGPETWDLLFPYSLTVVAVRRKPGGAGTSSGTGGTGSGTSTGTDAPATRETKLDNIAYQTGFQLDKHGGSAVFVLQATWKTDRLPHDWRGHYEHSGGVNLVEPLGSATGKNLQAYYQLTRAEVGDLKLSDKLKLTADVWVQPYLQFPLDSGTKDDPNGFRFGAGAGGTVQLEIKPDEDSPTYKLFVQGAGTVSGGKGGFDATLSGFAGVSVEFDTDLFSGKSK